MYKYSVISMGEGGVVTFYMKDRRFWKRFIKIAERDGKKASSILQKYIENYVSLHEPGNPQTLIPSFGEGGKITISDIEGRVRQICLERKEGLNYLTILDIIKNEGISDGSMRAAMAERVASWLHERKMKIYR